MGKVEGKIEAQVEKVTIGGWELKQVGVHGTDDMPVYSLKNRSIEIRFLPGFDWFDLKWCDKDEYTYTGGAQFSAQSPHLFQLHDQEA